MTKTEAKRLVAELRREAASITQALTPTPQWVAEQIGLDQGSEKHQAALGSRIEEALNNIDGLSALLREGLIDVEG